VPISQYTVDLCHIPLHLIHCIFVVSLLTSVHVPPEAPHPFHSATNKALELRLYNLE
jgi:hypothetical protein